MGGEVVLSPHPKTLCFAHDLVIIIIQKSSGAGITPWDASFGVTNYLCYIHKQKRDHSSYSAQSPIILEVQKDPANVYPMGHKI